MNTPYISHIVLAATEGGYDIYLNGAHVGFMGIDCEEEFPPYPETVPHILEGLSRNLDIPLGYFRVDSIRTCPADLKTGGAN